MELDFMFLLRTCRNERLLWKRQNFLFPQNAGNLFFKREITFSRNLFHTFFFVCGAATQRGSWPPHSLRFLDHTQRRTTVGRTPLDEWSARRRDLYLTTHNTHNSQKSMPTVGFEPMISVGEQPQTYALDRAATGTGNLFHTFGYNTSLLRH